MKNKAKESAADSHRELAKEKYLAGFLFTGIAREDAERLVDSLDFSLRELRRGDEILRHGSSDACFGVIVSGRAIVRRASGGRRLILRQMNDGAYFGASSLFGGESFPTDIVADSACTVAIASEEAMERLLTRDPRIAMNYIRFLSGRIRFLNDSIDSYSIRSADERIAKFLLRLCDGGSGRVKSYTRMADELGIGRASLYRSLDGLEERGIISRTGQEITLLDPNALRLIADGE